MNNDNDTNHTKRGRKTPTKTTALVLEYKVGFGGRAKRCTLSRSSVAESGCNTVVATLSKRRTLRNPLFTA